MVFMTANGINIVTL